MNKKEIRSQVRRELGYRDAKIKSGQVVVDKKTKAKSRASRKKETRKEIQDSE